MKEIIEMKIVFGSEYKDNQRIFTKLLTFLNPNPKSKRTFNSYFNKAKELEKELTTLKTKLQNSCEHNLTSQQINYHYNENPHCEGTEYYSVKCVACNKSLGSWSE